MISAPSRSSMSCESVMNCTPRVAASSSRLGLLGWNYGNESSNSWFRVQVRVQVRVRVRVQVRVRVRVQVRIRVVSPTCVAHLLDHLETSLASSSSLGLLLPSLSAGPTGLDWTWLDFLGPAIRTIRDWRRAFMLFSTSPPSIRVTGALWPATTAQTPNAPLNACVRIRACALCEPLAVTCDFVKDRHRCPVEVNDVALYKDHPPRVTALYRPRQPAEGPDTVAAPLQPEDTSAV